MNFSAIVARFAPPPPSVAKIAAAAGQSTIKLSFTRNWKQAMELIAEKLDTAHSERTRLVGNRRALLLDAVQGEAGADAKLAKVERELADQDRQIAQLRDANALARERDDAEKAAAAIADYARRKTEWEQRNVDLLQLAEQADALANKAAAAFVELADKAEEQARTAPVELHGFPSERPLGLGRAETAARHAFAAAGAQWAWNTPFRWPAPPSISETIASGLEWARAEVERGEHRKNAANSAA